MNREEAELLAKKYVTESDIAMREYRAAVIEECARVVEARVDRANREAELDGYGQIAAAIRALKP